MEMTDKQMGNILSDMVIIVDTREQKNGHILKFFEEQKIKYVIEKLETGDYSFYLPNYPELNFNRKFIIEKKNSLDEIAGNFTKDRDRFTKEFERIRPDEHMHLVIENATWKKLFRGSYRSKLSPKSFMASIMSWCIRYSVPVWFVGVDESPTVIYNLLYYELFEQLKKIRNKA